jgi:integrase
MARLRNKLTVRKIDTLKLSGWYSDGGNLYLKVGQTLSKSWVFRYVRDEVTTNMGLGSCDDVSLEEAREKAADLRKQLTSAIDPLAKKRKDDNERKLKTAKMLTFKECSEAYINAHKTTWKNHKHIQQWTNTLTQYAYPVFGDFAVADIDITLVTKCLEPIWSTKNETATRVRGRIESILDWATVRNYRQGDNPARWRGHLDKVLAKPSKVQNTKHHSALAYAELNSFIEQLQTQNGIAAKCLEFTILTAARTGETIGATWAEIDLGKKIWTIPADRMKAKREHRVPLTNHALTILNEMAAIRFNDYVFPSNKKGLSNMAMLTLLKRMERTDITVHGFRSAFRDWAAESTAYPSEVVEMALAHTIKNQVEAAYRRGDLLEKRVRLMESWTVYCMTPRVASDVVPLFARQA